MAALMFECERKTLFQVDGKRELRWMVKSASSIPEGGVSTDIRCRHCHGRLRIVKQKSDADPPDHVAHFRRKDSEACRGSADFKGVHQRSLEPVR